MENLEIRDNRREKFYTIDNIIYDNEQINLQALALYNHFARWSDNNTQKSYVSIKSFCERWKIGKATAYKALKLLEELKLIITKRKNGVPTKVTLLNLEKSDLFSTEHPCSPQNTPVLHRTQSKLNKKTNNNTNKQEKPASILYQFCKEYFFNNFYRIHGKKWSWADPNKNDTSLKKTVRMAMKDTKNNIDEARQIIIDKGVDLEYKIKNQRNDYWSFQPHIMNNRWNDLGINKKESISERAARII